MHYKQTNNHMKHKLSKFGTGEDKYLAPAAVVKECSPATLLCASSATGGTSDEYIEEPVDWLAAPSQDPWIF